MSPADKPLRIHLLGVGGTLMANLALLLREAGHQVRGSDGPLYSPMRELLADSGIEVAQGQAVADLTRDADLYIVGNALSRGQEQVEHLLRHRLPFVSAPQALHRLVLRRRPVWALAGTHGKTTTTAILAHLLQPRKDAGWLIAGQPAPPLASSRLGGEGEDAPFAIEADEYDCAFFDKGAKFLHYFPERAVISGIEFDHADIYQNIDQILVQFHRLLRCLPESGSLSVPLGDAGVERVLAMGCWCPVRRFALHEQAEAAAEPFDGVVARPLAQDWSAFALQHRGRDGAATELGEVRWGLRGQHNALNAAAAMTLLLEPQDPRALLPHCERLSQFQGVARRQQLLCPPEQSGGVEVYDDFAHHPTAIAATLRAMAAPQGGRLLAVLELRSNTMAAGVHGSAVDQALAGADLAWVHHRSEPQQGYVLGHVPGGGSKEAADWPDAEALAVRVAEQVRPGDRLVLMSNGSFDGFGQKLLQLLRG